MGLILSSNGLNLTSEILVSCRPVLFPASTLYGRVVLLRLRSLLCDDNTQYDPNPLVPIVTVGPSGRPSGEDLRRDLKGI